MEAKKLNQLIKSIGTSAKTAREQIQIALCGCAYQVVFHRNTDPFNRLLEAVGNGTRKEGMLKWASTYAPIHFAKGEVKLSDARQKEMVATLTEEEFAATMAESALWYDMAKPVPIANPWDSVKFAETLALHLEQAAKKAEKNGDSELAKLVQDAEMLFRVKLNAAKFDVVEVG